LDAQLREPLTHVDGGLERLALDDTSDKASSESITGTVGVVDAVSANGVDWRLFYLSAAALLCGDGDGGVGALGDDHSPCTLGVFLGALGNLLRNLLDCAVFSVVVRLGKGGGFGLVADEDIDVGQDLVERVLEELGDEGCGKVEDEDLPKLVSAMHTSPQR
jgi:hypothetical protein